MSISAVEDCQRELLARIERDGFAFLRGAVSTSELEEMRGLFAAPHHYPNVARRGDSIYGIRDLLTTVTGIREAASRSPLIDWVTKILGPSSRPVYGVFFDKTSTANWPIPWHQDITIRVRERRDVPGFEHRPVKDGTVHLIPPVELSSEMLALRIHLDDASSTHGALRVIPGSHRLGRLSNEELQRRTIAANSVTCEVRAGDIMLMRPLLVHASSACGHPGHRRVIHVEYAAFDLPGGLEWHG